MIEYIRDILWLCRCLAKFGLSGTDKDQATERILRERMQRKNWRSNYPS